MPARKSSPRRDDGDEAIRERVRLAQRNKMAKKYEERMEKKRAGVTADIEGTPDFEDNVMLQLEYILNAIIACVAASLPASQAQPDYWTAGLLVVLNLAYNALIFRAQWADRLIVYGSNFFIYKYASYVRMMPAVMNPVGTLFLVCSNTLGLAAAYWFYMKDLSDDEYNGKIDGAFVATVAANVLVLSVTGVIPWGQIAADIVA